MTIQSFHDLSEGTALWSDRIPSCAFICRNSSLLTTDTTNPDYLLDEDNKMLPIVTMISNSSKYMYFNVR